jgi:hypothetical protein
MLMLRESGSAAVPPQSGLLEKQAKRLISFKKGLPKFMNSDVERRASNRMNGHGMLMDFLTALGQDARITVKPTRKEHGATSVVVD